MNPLPLNVLYYGREESLPELRQLQAGLLSVELEEGNLLSVRWRQWEILRKIYVAVRDRNWGTVPRRLSNLEVSSNADSFRISYQAEHRQGDIDFVWDANILATAEGILTFSMEGQARSTFLRNRIGFCLLHPAKEYAGRAFIVQQDDGIIIEALFPTAIAPQQPLPGTERMRMVAFEAAPGLRAEIQFEGDLFQMEDQRNWTDATFKTFCTPLSLPYPVEVREGTRVFQAIVLKIIDPGTAQSFPAKEEQIKLSIGKAVSRSLPRVGLGLASRGQPLTATEISRLKALHLSHLRVDLHLSDAKYPAILAQATAEAQQLEVPLEAALFLSDSAESELWLLYEELGRFHPPISTWLIFHAAEMTPSQKWVELGRQVLGAWSPEIRFGSGTNAYFYHLNQARPLMHGLDLVCYSMHPQEHAFDNRSIVETLDVQAETVRNLRELAGELPIVISPVTLKPRFNPNATGFLSGTQPGELPSEVDVRQVSLLGAAWTLGSLKSLAENGVFSATYYETTGWRGVMEGKDGSPLPGRFRSLPGSVFPLYHVIADVTEFQGGEVLETRSTHPLKVIGLALFRNGIKRVLITNLTNEAQFVTVVGVAGRLNIAELNEHSVMWAMILPEEFRSQPGRCVHSVGNSIEVSLLPYATARIEEERCP
ncbi:MAG: hypothetical protein L0387_33135 [Acidobacteria bacterium]|nr:hypothetical protein [Acidobacteriota bacterium]MCI0718857.1 hypothetical protein [Acidobacteriota bacterium]